MVHNGIEYGVMAAYAEGINVLHHANVGKKGVAIDAETTPLREPEHYQYDFNFPDIAEVWRRGSVVASWLLDLTAVALLDQPGLEGFSGQVSDSGEGRWTLAAANDEGCPVPVLVSGAFPALRFARRISFLRSAALGDAVSVRRASREEASQSMTLRECETVDLPTPTGPMRSFVFQPADAGRYPGVLFYSEIFQVTAPIRRMAAWLAGHGYVVAVPEIYHEFEPAGRVLPYDQAGAERGNALKKEKELHALDGDARAVLDFLKSHDSCTGRLGALGICIGGHLSFRAAAKQPDVLAAACFYGTDLHTATLSKTGDDTLASAAEIRAS